MTKFDKSKFSYFGGYLRYEGKFVARFKHVPANRAGFVKFLIANFTVEEYFAAFEAGTPPAKILETKGYVPTHIKKLLRGAGYPETPEGFSAYIKAEIARRAA